MTQKVEVPSLKDGQTLVVAVMEGDEVCAIYKISKDYASVMDGIDIRFN